MEEKARIGTRLGSEESGVVNIIGILVVFGFLIALVVAAFFLGVLPALGGSMLVIMGALFAIQVLPPRGWFGVILGAVFAIPGLAILVMWA
jgi:hypothetical protein